MSLKQVRLVLWGAVGAFAAVALILLVMVYADPRNGMLSATDIQMVTPNMVVTDADEYGLGTNFVLTDHHGDTITQEALLGHPVAVFFGFTHCPEVCPTSMYDLGIWMDELGADGDKLKPVFITLDPERDTTTILKEYVDAINPRMTAITGAPEAIAALAKDWGVFSKRVPIQAPIEDGAETHYNIDHTASIFLIKPDGEFRGTIAYGEAPNVALQKLKNLVAGT